MYNHYIEQANINGEMKMNVQKVINGKLNSLYIKSVMKKNGWSKDYMRAILIDHVTCGQAISLFDFVEASK
jgi:hypothetical protein